jgi:mannose-6-phosphate isomerase
MVETMAANQTTSPPAPTPLANPRRTRLGAPRGNRAARLMVNAVRTYEWGSRHVLARLQGRDPGGAPEAELWLGAHPSAPSHLVGASGATLTLPEAIAQDPLGTLGAEVLARFGPRLPFLLKILAIERALSIQVHPSPDQARDGYRRERELGLDDGTYVDPYAKPELLYAVTAVQALAGLREPRRAGRLLDLLDSPRVATARQAMVVAQKATPGEGALGAVLALTTWPAQDRALLVEEVAQCARRALAYSRIERDPDALSALLWVLRLTEQHPEDPLVLAPLLLDLHELAPGQTIFLPAGVPHAYLSGTAVEIMASSDNVVRAGLTPKKVDPEAVAALTDVTAKPRLDAGSHRLSAHETAWCPPVEEFQLIRVDVTAGAAVELTPVNGPQILLCLRGAVELETDVDRLPLAGGQSAFLRADAAATRLTGEGEVFRAIVGAADRTGVLPRQAVNLTVLPETEHGSVDAG